MQSHVQRSEGHLNWRSTVDLGARVRKRSSGVVMDSEGALEDSWVISFNIDRAYV